MSTPCQTARADIVFVLDSSSTVCPSSLPGSTNCSNWAAMLALVVNLVDRVDIGSTRVGLVRYASTAESVFYLANYTRWAANGRLF